MTDTYKQGVKQLLSLGEYLHQQHEQMELWVEELSKLITELDPDDTIYKEWEREHQGEGNTK